MANIYIDFMQGGREMYPRASSCCWAATKVAGGDKWGEAGCWRNISQFWGYNAKFSTVQELKEFQWSSLIGFPIGLIKIQPHAWVGPFKIRLLFWSVWLKGWFFIIHIYYILYFSTVGSPLSEHPGTTSS